MICFIDPVEDVTATTLSTTSIKVTWTDNGAAALYQIEWFEFGVNDSVGQDNSSEKEYTIGGLTPGTKYSIDVYACSDENCQGAISNASSTLGYTRKYLSVPCYVK